MVRKSLLKCTGFLLTAVLTASMLTACGSNTDSGSTTATDNGTTASNDTDNGETQEINVMIWDRGSSAPGTSNEENEMTKWIQEQVLEACNVKVNFVAVPRSGSDDKLNVMMAGGNAPDIVFSYNQSIFSNFASNGGLADLTDAYAKYGTDIQTNIGNIQYMGVVDNKQYAIMKRRGQQVPRHVSYIRKDWLDALGLSIPKTKEELFTVLEAFKEKNPGNVSDVVPWAMGGSTDTEKFYLSFVGSYVAELSEEDAYVYAENYKVFADGAIDGLKKLNELYNKGLITQDFATDTTTDIFKQDVSAGNAGFILADATEIFDLIPTLQSSVDGAEFVPLNCFDTPEGEYINPTEPLYGMYVMVPKTSESKADACVKYLNWLSDATNAENVMYTPEHTLDSAGVPVSMLQDELNEKGYPGNIADYNIVNDHFSFVDNKDSVVDQWANTYNFLSTDWFNSLYTVMNTNQYLYPTYPVVLESETTYGAKLSTMAIEYAYKLISCKSDEFDSLQQSEYKKLVTAGLETVLNDRRAYYEQNVAKK
ncbi:carbohydrate ABC transporter substrate-binding protein (CUT1 family) [Lachnotalea glycerini]|uniref:Carbohydrate ABC transporter substrate-binding protein (CUT1 family) n=2 Tax=Lachnotalea glycerini TaxID=1763509 RepID=A0A318ENX6_9FIRM|nr:extracellular solute-binding protein [Lachnotalea glycerini]PXV91785.1 carbohydrate ABC transporter substrate-binding protein (CUT1 family) [Lachnotalea glycerini]